MIRIEKLNEDAQIAIIIIMAKKALSYLEKDTCTAKHVVETQNAEYPVEGVVSDIQIADAALEKYWEWIETKNFAVLVFQSFLYLRDVHVMLKIEPATFPVPKQDKRMNEQFVNNDI